LSGDGATAAGAKITLAGNQSSYGTAWLQSVRSGSDNRFGIGEGANELFTIIFDYASVLTKRGYVGIGTTAPSKKLDVSGEIRASTGILFGTDTAATNTLSDYEEGTWTPIVAGLTSGTKTPTSGNQGWYIKIGKLVVFGGTLSWSGGDAIVGSVVIQGLPYTSSTGRAWGSLGVTPGGITVTAGYTGLALVIDPGRADAYIIQTTTASYNHAPGVNASGTLYGFGGTYRVN